MRGGGTNWKNPRPATVKKITRDFVRHILTTYDECRYAEPTRIEEFKKQTDAILVAHYPMLATQEAALAASSQQEPAPLVEPQVDDAEPAGSIAVSEESLLSILHYERFAGQFIFNGFDLVFLHRTRCLQIAGQPEEKNYFDDTRRIVSRYSVAVPRPRPPFVTFVSFCSKIRSPYLLSEWYGVSDFRRDESVHRLSAQRSCANYSWNGD
jgi:hypothetical protein